MEEIIKQKIENIEKSQGIQVLYACESGSRAWGFASVDSDYDVRLIYKRKREDYLQVVQTNDFLNLSIDSVLDFNAWDIKKVLGLMIRSNTTIFEWIQSPIVYQESGSFKEELWQLSQDYYCQQTHVHHYLGLAKKKLIQNQGEQIKYKTLFYILRALFSAQWNITYCSIAPMEFIPLLELVGNKQLKEQILQLIKEKEGKTEKDWYRWDDALNKYVVNLYESLSKATLSRSKGSFEIEQANCFFRREVDQ